MNFKTIPLKYSVFQEDDNPLFGESVTHISIDDEGGGGYVVLEQFPDDTDQKIRLDLPEFEELLRIGKELVAAYDKVIKDQS